MGGTTGGNPWLILSVTSVMLQMVKIHRLSALAAYSFHYFSLFLLLSSTFSNFLPLLHLDLSVDFLLFRGFYWFLFPRKLTIHRMKGRKGKGATKKNTAEALKPIDDRKVGKRKAAVKAEKSKPKKATMDKKAKKDPNKPKRPASAFFIFLEEFREIYKREHPNVKGVAAVGKAGGEKWKSMSNAEKAPYEAKATKRKSDYEKQMLSYNKKQESNADDGDEESDRSKSEINDEEDDDSGEEEDEDDDDEDDD